MKISTYGPPPNMRALAEIIKYIPPDSENVLIQTPLRNSIDRRACQHPGWLFYDASCDNKVFLHLSQASEMSPYEVKT